MDPPSLLDWQVGICDWYLSGGDNPPSEKIQFTHLLQVIPEELKTRLVRVGAAPIIMDTMTFQNNVGQIIKEMLKKFPKDQQQAAIFNGTISHDETITGQEFLLNVAKRVHHCDLFKLSSEQIVILWSITNIKNTELSTYLYKHMNELVTQGTFQNFLDKAEERHYALLANPDKHYDGLGTGKPIDCKATTSRNPRNPRNPKEKSDVDWKKEFPCFKCAKDGHIDSDCKETSITQCSIGNCRKVHSPRAHQNMEDHIKKKEMKEGSKETKEWYATTSCC